LTFGAATGMDIFHIIVPSSTRPRLGISARAERKRSQSHPADHCRTNLSISVPVLFLNMISFGFGTQQYLLSKSSLKFECALIICLTHLLSRCMEKFSKHSINVTQLRWIMLPRLFLSFSTAHRQCGTNGVVIRMAIPRLHPHRVLSRADDYPVCSALLLFIFIVLIENCRTLSFSLNCQDHKLGSASGTIMPSP
jgi:hypothetical protein